MLEEIGKDFIEVRNEKCLFYLPTRTVNLRGGETMRLMSKNNDLENNRIISLMQTDKSFDAPSDAIQWSKNIFLSRAVEPKKSIVERVLAVLQMDLSPNRAAFGERSASASPARQMLFQAGKNSLDLRIKQEENGLMSVRGQILGEGFADCLVVISNENASFETRANELSEFKFADVPSGKYALSFRNREKEIVVEDIGIE